MNYRSQRQQLVLCGVLRLLSRHIQRKRGWGGLDPQHEDAADRLPPSSSRHGARSVHSRILLSTARICMGSIRHGIGTDLPRGCCGRRFLVVYEGRLGQWGGGALRARKCLILVRDGGPWSIKMTWLNQTASEWLQPEFSDTVTVTKTMDC